GESDAREGNGEYSKGKGGVTSALTSNLFHAFRYTHKLGAHGTQERGADFQRLRLLLADDADGSLRCDHGLGAGGTNLCSPYTQPSNRPPRFRVRVYNDHLHQSLLEDGKTSSTSPGSFGRSVKSGHSAHQRKCDLKPCLQPDHWRQKKYLLQLTQRQLLQDRLVRDQLVKAAASKVVDVRLSAEVSTGQTFVQDLDRAMGIADEAQHSKTLKQFQEWDAKVHVAIQVRMWRRNHRVALAGAAIFSSNLKSIWIDDV
ncbi:unnamed protein product, partial [Pylaiella littoralis]